MTLFMIFLIVCYLAILALLWLFRGFNRALKEGPRTVGLLVRVVEVDGDSPKQNTNQVVELPRQHKRPVSPAAASRKSGISRGAVSLVGLAILVGSLQGPGTH